MSRVDIYLFFLNPWVIAGVLLLILVGWLVDKGAKEAATMILIAVLGFFAFQIIDKDEREATQIELMQTRP